MILQFPSKVMPITLGKKGMEHPSNLMSLSYHTMPLLPYSDKTFPGYQPADTQEAWYEIQFFLLYHIPRKPAISI